MSRLLAAAAALALAALPAAPALAEEWLPMAQADGLVIYIADERRPSPDNAAWTEVALRFDFASPVQSVGSTPPGRLYRSSVTLLEVDCTARKTRITTAMEFEGPAMTGRPAVINYFTAWEAPAPSGPTSVAIVLVCGS